MIVTLVFSFLMIFQVNFLFYCYLKKKSKVRDKLSQDNLNYDWHFYLGVVLIPMAVCEMVSGIGCYHSIARKKPISKSY